MKRFIFTVFLLFLLVILVISLYKEIENKTLFFLIFAAVIGFNIYWVIKNKNKTIISYLIKCFILGLFCVFIILITDDNKTETTAEKEYQADIQREKVVEERKSAILRIETTIINNYPFDVVTLSQSQKTELDTIADILNYYSDIKVIIIGHSCEIGSKSVNQRKGLKRAETGKEYLIEKGIDTDRILVESKGETQPLISNKSSESRKQNRRIEFLIE